MSHWFWMVRRMVVYRFRMVVSVVMIMLHHLQAQLFHVGLVKWQPKHHLHAERVAHVL